VQVQIINKVVQISAFQYNKKIQLNKKRLSLTVVHAKECLLYEGSGNILKLYMTKCCLLKTTTNQQRPQFVYPERGGRCTLF
jgi:hypothetical protein